MPAIEWTAEELAALAAVSSLEYQETVVAWQRYAPRQARAALAGAGGDPLSRRVLDQVLTAVGQVILDLSVRAQTNAVQLEEWQLQMADFIQFVHLAGAGAAVGGINALTVADVGQIEATRRFQLDRLQKLAVGLDTGSILLDGRFLRRSQMYGEAGRGTYYEIAENAFVRLGFDLVRSRRSARDSCEECISLDGREFAIGDPLYKKPGRRICLSSCRCYEEYINSSLGLRRLV